MKPQSSDTVTIRDVARAAGVSPMTVSRVLSNKPGVREEKVDAVRRAAKELGYEVNMIVRSVMAEMRRRKKTFAGTIAFLNSGDFEHAWTEHPYNREYFDSAKRQAEQSGFQMDSIWIRQTGWSPRRTSDVLKARGIQGFLVVPGSDPEQFAFDCADFAMSSFGGLTFSFPIHQALPDYFHNYALCHDELRKRRYQRVGLFLPDYDMKMSGKAMLGGFLAAQWKTPEAERVPIGFADGNWASSKNAFLSWFMREKPDAVVAAYGEIPKWLGELGLKVPEDVALAHPSVAADVAEWSGIDMRRSLQAAAAVDLLTAQILRNEKGFVADPKTITITGRWMDGKTTPVHA